MSKSEILDELVKLTRDERGEIIRRVHELDGDDWLDEGALSDQVKALLKSRLAEHEQNPTSAIPWEEFEARLNRRLGS